MPATVQDAPVEELEKRARALVDRFGRAAWVVLVEDDHGELHSFSNVGEGSLATLMSRWKRQARTRCFFKGLFGPGGVFRSDGRQLQLPALRHAPDTHLD